MATGLKKAGTLAGLSGILLTAAFPKIGISLLAWFALVPLLAALRGLTPTAAFRTGMLAGLAHYLTLLYWVVFTMRVYGYLPWWQCVSLLVLLAAYLALFPGIFAMALVRCCHKPVHLILLAPVFWVALEYARTFLLTGFPWSLVGYSQFNRLPIIQIADMFGVYGISFLVLLVNAAIYLLLLFAAGKAWNGVVLERRQVVRAAALALVLIGLSVLYGRHRIAAMDAAMAVAPSTRVAVIQGNIDQAVKWDPAFQIRTTKKYLDLTRSAVARQPDLVVWPETATPFYFKASPKLTGMVTDAVRQSGVPLLVGSPSVQRGTAGRPEYYNSAYLVAPDGSVAGRYDKVHLVPFGEYVPLKGLLSFVGKMVAQVGDFSAGEKGRTLAWGPDHPKIGVQICFEIIFPGLCRSLVKNNAGLLVNLTNDAWFGRSSATYQHFSMAALRAVENRRSLVRAANTGISGVVDPVGRVVRRTDLFADAVIVDDVLVLSEKSFYTRMGDLLPLVCLFVMGTLMGLAWRAAGNDNKKKNARP
ncbi:apolipoprotein N-acyltransferase [Desulfosarcina ovata]|uniref:Apolipoprotein N-acyltransferase n=1 Tax=Desulfosarcina ovata subsp. ovata TaxID=2752305 RepID=A0A5K8AKG1_9BACT|nr:apolipoprotein N-acyltransferase [Desulfosarcina ovata]BBO92290.1 apolipoprotein N-acyltransferase [Desulfosarcina ovata subsp. ovata]